MNNKIKIAVGFFASLAVSVFLSSCGNKTRSKASDVGTLSIEVGFQQIVDEVFSASGGDCIRCHATYVNYSIASKLAGSMLSQVTSGRMPKGGPPLEPGLQQLLATWVGNGAPEEAGGAAAKPVPLEPTFESIQVNVFAPKCLSCHTGGADTPAPPLQNFTSFETLLAANSDYEIRTGFPLFDTEFPEDSDFIFLLKEQNGRPPIMPIKKLPGDPNYVPPADVTAEELEVIIEWIRTEKRFKKSDEIDENLVELPEEDTDENSGTDAEGSEEQPESEETAETPGEDSDENSDVAP